MAEDDAVHLTAAAYNDIAAVLSHQAENHGRQPATGPVRRRLTSVIPAATEAAPPVREPAWISGEAACGEASVEAPAEASGEDVGGAPGEVLATTPIRVTSL